MTRDPATPAFETPALRGACLAVAGLLLLAGCSRDDTPPEPPTIAALAETLAETGLYAPGSLERVADGVLPYSPQYPLWTDGAAKRRWIRLPVGTAIEASDPDAWRFPVGTKLWKEFAFGRRVETRLLERLADGTWRFAAYAWSPDGREATLAPEAGVRRAHMLRPGVFHDIPSRQDCLACHGGRRDPVLGFTALQLSPDRDPLAPHAETPEPGSVDLATLKDRGWLDGHPRLDGEAAPRIAARSARERAALGYLHANCAACHTAGGPLADLGLAFDVRLGDGSASPTLAATLGRPARFRWPGAAADTALRLVAGHPETSLLYRRAASRDAAVQMPPLGTKTPDTEALELLEAWIREDLAEPVHPPRPPEE